MGLRLGEYQYGSARRRGEGLRVGTARYLPRGVRKKDLVIQDLMDVWLPTLAPSKRLLAWAKKSNLPDREWWQTYLRRYRNEMKLTAACQTIATLALLARKTPISIGCYCDTDYCHRFELVRLIKQAASRR